MHRGHPLTLGLLRAAYQVQWQCSSLFLDEGRFSCILFKIATALFSHMHLFDSSMALCASDPVCDGTVWTPGVPGALRNALSGISAVGRVATADATRRRSRDVFCVTSDSESAHTRFKVKPAFGSMRKI